MRVAEKSREDWIAECKEIFIEMGMPPEHAAKAAEKYVKHLEEAECRLIYGDQNAPEPIGLLHDANIQGEAK